MWTFLAVDMALINACLESPNENTVLYFAASNKASINKAEHRNDNRAAKDTAVIKFAMLVGSSVLVVVVIYVAGLYATTLEESSSDTVFCWMSGTAMEKKIRKGKERERAREREREYTSKMLCMRVWKRKGPVSPIQHTNNKYT